jgi:hypothetical protein
LFIDWASAYVLGLKLIRVKLNLIAHVDVDLDVDLDSVLAIVAFSKAS